MLTLKSLLKHTLRVIIILPMEFVYDCSTVQHIILLYMYWIHYLYEYKHRYTPLDGLPEAQLRVNCLAQYIVIIL